MVYSKDLKIRNWNENFIDKMSIKYDSVLNILSKYWLMLLMMFFFL